MTAMWQLDEILDQSLSQIAAGKARVESCLVTYPAMADELEPLLLAAERLRAIPKPEMAPAARAQIEERVLVAAAANPLLRPAARRWPLIALPRWRWGLSALTAVVIFVFLMMTTLVTASADALPGSALYPIKLTAEDAWLWIAPERLEPGLRLRLAQRRLDEIVALAEQGEFDESVLDSMLNHVEEALIGVEGLPPALALPLLDELTVLFEEQQATLSLMLDELPPVSRRYVEAAVETLVEQAVRTGILLRALRGGEPAIATEPAKTPTPTGTSELVEPLLITVTVASTLTPTSTPTPMVELMPTEAATLEPTSLPSTNSTPNPPPQPTDTQPPPLQPTDTQPPPPPQPTDTQPPPPAQPTDTRVPPGQTKTPQPPGLTKTPGPGRSTKP